MYSDLKDYQPKEVEFELSDVVKETFPLTLDFNAVKEAEGLSDVKKLMNFIAKRFTCEFPSNESATRKLDEFEIRNIREEYCTVQENEVPKRKQELEETIEMVKAMKKKAEAAYDAILDTVSRYAAEVKAGTREQKLSATETFRIALAGYHLTYTFDKERGVFVLAKAGTVYNRSELWSSEEMNRQSMLDLFGLEFPEAKKPDEEEQEEEDEDDLPWYNREKDDDEEEAE